MNYFLKLSVAILETSLLIFSTSALLKAQNPEIVVQTGHSGLYDTEAAGITSLAFSPANWNQYTLASGGEDFTIKLWDTQQDELRLLRTLIGHKGPISFLSFTLDGKFIISTGGQDNTLIMWDVLTGEKELEVPDCGIAALSRNSKIVACAQYHFARTDLATSTIKLINVDVNSSRFAETVRTVADDFADQVSAFAFSPDGNKLAAVLRSRFSNEEMSISLWDLRFPRAKAREINIFDFLANDKFDSINFSGVTIQSQLTFSRDGQKMFLGDKTISSWDVSQKKLIKLYDGLFGWFALNSDESQIAAADCGIGIWQTNGGEKSKQVEKLECLNQDESEEQADEDVHKVPVAFSKNNKLLAYGRQKLIITDLQNDENFDFEQSDKITGSDIKFGDFTISTDEESGKGFIYLGNKENDDYYRKYGFLSGVNYGLTSPDGELEAQTEGFLPSGEAVGNLDDVGEISLFKIKGGKRTEIKLSKGSYKDEIFSETRAMGFSQDSKFLISGHLYGEVIIWNIEKRILAKLLRGHSGEVTSIRFHPKIKDVFFTLAEQTELKIWQTNGDLIATLFILNDKDWLVMTPEGFFDGTAEAQKQILWRLNKYTFDVVPIEAFYYEYYNPGLLKKVLLREKPELPSNASNIKAFAEKDIRQADVHICQKCPCSRENQSPDSADPVNQYEADICIDILASPDFAVTDFTNFNALAKALVGKEPFAQKVFAGFIPDSQAKIKNYVRALVKNPERKPGNEILQIMRRELQAFLRQDDFFDKFKGYLKNISPETLALRESNPQGDAAAWLNRNLLEDAFPKDIRRGMIRNLESLNGQPLLSAEMETDQKGRCPENEVCLQDMRLFWNNRVIKRWRGDMLKNCTNVSKHRIQCEIKVPLIKGIENKYTVYLFNQDRVKSKDGQLVLR